MKSELREKIQRELLLSKATHTFTFTRDELIDLFGLPAPGEAVPIPMILFCPKCHLQHVDEPDDRTPDWKNPPHRSHLCHGCGCIWRPADVATVGVKTITTKGKADNFDYATAPPQVAEVTDAMVAGWNACRKQIYALCEHIGEESDEGCPDRYMHGRRVAAKDIAKAIGSFEAIDCDYLKAAHAARGG